MRFAILLSFAVLFSACGAPVSHSCDGPVVDHVTFVDRLRCAGLKAEIGPAVAMPALRPPGTTLLLSGGAVSGVAELQSFNYDDRDQGGAEAGWEVRSRAAAEADARKFASDGSLRDASQRIYYRSTPHLFHQSRVLVVYAGDDAAVIALLTRLLGKQFAGG